MSDALRRNPMDDLPPVGREPPPMLVQFLYVLMRDHLPAGAVADIVKNHTKPETFTYYSNHHLAQYAREIARELTPESLPPRGKVATL
jgi:hypothetical protein